MKKRANRGRNGQGRVKYVGRAGAATVRLAGNSRRLVIVFLLSAVSMAQLTACGAGGRQVKSGDWPLPNLDRSSSRAMSASGIDQKNVASLHVAWRFRFTHSSITNSTKSPETMRAAVSTPLVVSGSIYVQDSQSSVFAIDRATGSLQWEHRFRAPNYGRNGLAYSSGSLYGSTDTTVFALSSKTGRMLWQRNLVSPQEQFVDIAPLIANNLVYVSTVGYPPGGKGALYALDAHSGTIRWRFSTIRDPWPHPAVTGGGGAWYTPSVGPDGTLYLGTANPYPLGGTHRFPNGSALPGSALYTDSLLVLAGKTGRLLWYDQVTPRDIRDYDFQLPPILADVSTPRGSRPFVIGGGKAGVVIAWNRSTRSRVWEASVGRHLHDHGPLPTRPEAICPGFFGGVESPMAYEAGRVFVPVVDLCARGSATGYQPIGTLDPAQGTGEFVALSAADGTTLWTRRFPQPDFGCATAGADVVFTATFDGHLYGLSQSNGAVLWQTRAPAGVNGCPALSGTMLFVVAGSATSRNPHPPFQLIAYTTR
jgi:glucose dehydrogenase